MVEAGESLEEAVIREIKEETGFTATPLGIIGMRCGVKEWNDTSETTIHVVYEMKYVSGSMKALDENEISNIEFVPIDVALSDPNVIELSKAFIRAACNSNPALSKQSKSINTNTRYKTYDVYTK
jgi:ADP-ribose pyrophosphatase YjhB (NUDIX family)